MTDSFIFVSFTLFRAALLYWLWFELRKKHALSHKRGRVDKVSVGRMVFDPKSWNRGLSSKHGTEAGEVTISPASFQLSLFFKPA
jgi:hypothetical protein